MLKITPDQYEQFESIYPGIIEQFMQFENQQILACPNCESRDTASVQVGIIGRTIHIATGTTKFKLIPNSPWPGRYFCNQCKKFFDA